MCWWLRGDDVLRETRYQEIHCLKRRFPMGRKIPNSLTWLRTGRANFFLASYFEFSCIFLRYLFNNLVQLWIAGLNMFQVFSVYICILVRYRYSECFYKPVVSFDEDRRRRCSQVIYLWIFSALPVFSWVFLVIQKSTRSFFFDCS